MVIERDIKDTGDTSQLLQFVKTTKISAVRHFVAGDHFKIGDPTEEGFRIFKIENNFTDHFLEKTEKNVTECELVVYTLLERSCDKQIVSELSGREAYLADFWQFLKHEARYYYAREKKVSIDETTNVFYISDAENITRAVCAKWYGYCNAFRISSYPLTHMGKWFPGVRIVSR